MKKKKLAIFTVARSDFGILKNIILKCEKDKRFDLHLVIGSAHKSEIFGKTIKEINSIKIKKKIFFKFKYNQSSNQSIIKYFQKTLGEAEKFFKRNKIDAALILGDRYEMLAISIVCLNYNIPIMHFGGGSITLGSLDNIYRYSISKMASAHFLETEHHKKNLQKIGINENLNVVGSPSIENVKFNFLKKKELFKKLQLRFDTQKKIIIACFHPETIHDKNYNIRNLKTFLSFLLKVNANLIITYPNADSGFNSYIKLIKKYLKKRKNSKIIKNLGSINYFSFLKISSLLIGNSSSGIIESASFKIPTINIGERQKDRHAPNNVINSKFSLKDIIQSYRKATSQKFISKLKNLKNPYFKKNVSSKSLDIIYKYLVKKT